MNIFKTKKKFTNKNRSIKDTHSLLILKKYSEFFFWMWTSDSRKL